MFAGVRSQRERKMAELRRMPCEWHNSSRDDHPSRFPGFPVFQSQLETSSVLLHETNFPAIQVRHGLRLEPASIVREAIERQRSGDLFSTLLLIGLQCQRSRRIGKMRSRQWRPKQHPLRHVPFPKRHWLAENANVQAIGGSKMSGRRQAIRAGPYNCYVTFRHVLSFSPR